MHLWCELAMVTLSLSDILVANLSSRKGPIKIMHGADLINLLDTGTTVELLQIPMKRAPYEILRKIQLVFHRLNAISGKKQFFRKISPVKHRLCTQYMTHLNNSYIS